MCTTRCSPELSWRGSASFRSLARISRASANKKKMKKMHSEFPFRTSCRNASPCPLPLVALKKSLPNYFSETKSTGRLQNHEDTPLHCDSFSSRACSCADIYLRTANSFKPPAAVPRSEAERRRLGLVLTNFHKFSSKMVSFEIRSEP